MLSAHGSAIEYDLMTKTAYRLSDVGKTLTLGSLAAFIEHLPADSALQREMHREETQWADGTANAWLLASILDQLQFLRYEFECAHGAKPQKPKPIGRPGGEGTRISDESKRLLEEFKRELNSEEA